VKFERDFVYKQTIHDIMEARKVLDLLMANNIVPQPDIKMLEDAVQKAIDAVK
jgi:hypothetical protein